MPWADQVTWTIAIEAVLEMTDLTWPIQNPKS